MKTSKINLIIGIVLLSVVTSMTASAQSPAVSPWLMLRDKNLNRGGLNSYYSYIKPQQEYNNALNAQAQQLRRTQSATRELQDQVSGGGGGFNSGQNDGQGLQAPKAGGPSTGARGAAAYRNYGHWYKGISGDPTPHGRQ
ncbi:MAG: hypothetical protein LBU65_12295 [Planctomycetaceae bacterium]|jgi:hypothetical protein|nr:hypothetical protein [Planctomycetaceae bacterium]